MLNKPSRRWGPRGTAILIKSTTAYYELSQQAKAEIQATRIKFKGLIHDLTIAAVYSPPKHNLKATTFENFFHTLGPNFLVGGDLAVQTSYGDHV